MTILHAVALRPCAGERVSGDAVLVIDGPVACVLVVDGLGHGEQAAVAAQTLVEHVKPQATQPILELLGGATAALSGTRGAAATLAQFDGGADELRVAGVGNVELYAASRARIAPAPAPGILGRPVRKLDQYTYPLTRGDRFVLFTDGISRRFDLRAFRDLSLEATAASILEKYSRKWDDATCVVVEYVGGS